MRIRYFAAAADAAGVPETALDAGPMRLGALVASLGADDLALAHLLARCSALVDGVRAEGPDQIVPAEARVDFLPPFAGG